MRPTTALDGNIFDFNALLHPGTTFEHPRDVVSHPNLSLADKRAILASWASNASAIALCPALRVPEGLKAPVTIDEIWMRFAHWTVARDTRRAASRCGSDRSNGARPHKAGRSIMGWPRIHLRSRQVQLTTGRPLH
jgi:hypothetical protein